MVSKTILSDRFIGMDIPDELAFPALLQRLIKKSKRTKSGCLEWTGWRSATGYGFTSFRGSGRPTHRLMYTAAIGPIPEGMQVLHSCDNPPCMNPRHLSLGSGQENMQQAVERGRHFEAEKTHCDRGHPLSGDNLYVAAKGGKRSCRMCQRARQRMALGWPRDLAFSAPKMQGHPPAGITRITPRTRKQGSSQCSKGHELAGRNRYVTPKGNVECRTCRQVARDRYAKNYQAKGFVSSGGVAK